MIHILATFLPPESGYAPNQNNEPSFPLILKQRTNQRPGEWRAFAPPPPPPIRGTSTNILHPVSFKNILSMTIRYFPLAHSTPRRWLRRIRPIAPARSKHCRHLAAIRIHREIHRVS